MDTKHPFDTSDSKIGGTRNVKPSPRRIVWAIDPFADDYSEQQEGLSPAQRHMMERVVPCLRALSVIRDTEIVPIHVLGPGAVNLPMGGVTDQWLEAYELTTVDRMRELLQNVKLPGLKEPIVLLEPRTTVDQAAARLIAYSAHIGADAIVVGEHARSGVSRMLLGSFAESLLNESSIPVLMIGPDAVSHPRIKTILFPTGFGERSKRAFRNVVFEAAALRARIVLFHAISQPVEPMLESGAAMLGGSWIPVQAYFSDELERHKRRTDAWARWARHQGVETIPVVDFFGGNIAEFLMRLTDRYHADLIAMEARSGPIVAVLIGSITKQVLRMSRLPVWVVRTHPLRQRRPEPRSGTESPPRAA